MITIICVILSSALSVLMTKWYLRKYDRAKVTIKFDTINSMGDEPIFVAEGIVDLIIIGNKITAPNLSLEIKEEKKNG